MSVLVSLNCGGGCWPHDTEGTISHRPHYFFPVSAIRTENGSGFFAFTTVHMPCVSSANDEAILNPAFDRGDGIHMNDE